MGASHLGYQAFFKRSSLEDNPFKENPFSDDTDDFDSWHYGWVAAETDWEASCNGEME